MFKSARRTAARWGNTLLAMLGLGLASPVPPTYGYQRQRDQLPQEVQNDRMIAAQERRKRRGLKRYHQLTDALAGYHLFCNRQIDISKIHPSWPYKPVIKASS